MPENKLKDIAPVKRIPHNQPVNVRLTDYSNSYDENFRPEYNQEFNRADNQSWHQQLGYGLISRSLSILPKLGSGVGSIYGVGKAAVTGEESAIWDNRIVNWMNNLDESIKDVLPVYQSMENAESGLLGKMATTSFWANDAFDGIAYAVSAFVPGNIIGKGAQAGSGALKATTVGTKLVDGLKSIGLNSQKTSLLGSTVYNTVSEAAVEAYQTQQEIQQLLLAKGMPPEEAKLKASEAASRTFRSNLAVLAVPNFIQNTMFQGGWNSLQKKVRDAVRTGNGTLADEAVKLESLRSKIAKGVISEGLWEENVQTSLSQYERLAAKSGNYDKDYTSEVASNMGKNILGFLGSFGTGEQTPEQIEGAVSIFLGGLIGSGSAFVDAANDKRELASLKEAEESRFKDIFTVTKPLVDALYTDQVNNIHTIKGTKTLKVGDKDVEVNDYALDDKGNAIADPEKIKNLTINQLNNKHFWDTDMIAAYRNDPALFELNRQTALSSYAYALASSNREIEDADIDLLAKQSEAEDATFLQENVDAIKKYVDKYKQLKNSIGSAKDDATNPDKSNFNQFLIKSNLYLTAKLEALNKVLPEATTEEGKKTINLLIEDTKQSLLELTNNRSALEKEYMKNIRQPEKEQFELRSLQAKKNKTAEEITRQNELTYKVGEHSFINGAATPFDNLTTKVGAKYSAQELEGATELAISQLEEALMDPAVDPLDLAKLFAKKIQVVTSANKDKVDSISEAIQSKINNVKLEIESMLADAISLNEMVNSIIELESFGDEGVDIIDEIFSNSSIQDLAKLANLLVTKGVDIDETTEFTFEWMEQNKNALNETLAHLRSIQSALTNELEAIEIAQLYSSSDPQLNPNLFRTSKELEEYSAASDKDAFLRKAFFDKKIMLPTVSYINRFDQAPESITDEKEFEILRDNLKAAKAALPDNTKIDQYIEVLDRKIYPTILKNKNNIAETHKITANRIINDFNTVLTNPDIYTLITNVLPDFKDIEFSYDSLKVLLHRFKQKATEEQVKTLTEKLVAYRAVIGNETLDSLISSSNDVLVKIANQLKKTQGFELRPNFNFPFIISKNINWQDDEIITKFLNDFNLDAVSASTNKIADAELLKDLIYGYRIVTTVNSVINQLQTDLDFDKLIELKKTEFIDQVPSLQQNIALTEGLEFLNKKVSKSDFANWLIVRGIGGAGKTYFMATKLLELQNKLGNSVNAFAFSKEDLTSININKAINADQTNNFDKFLSLSEEELNKIDLLIIDEIYTFNNDQIQSIRNKLTSVNKTIKVIALGDPSQITAEKNFNFSEGLYVNYALPLTTSYRTSVNAISSYVSKFQLNPYEVGTITAQANMSLQDMLTDRSSATGVIIVNEENFEDLLNAKSDKTTVVLTNDPQLRSYYAASGVDAKMIAESQGYQWDQVFVHINPAFLPSDDFEANKILYTAYSRTKNLLAIVGDPTANTEPNTELESKIEQSNNQLVLAAELFQQNLESVNNLEDILSGKVTFTKDQVTPTEVEDEEAPLTSDTVQTPSYVQVELDNIAFTFEDNEGAKLAYPTNYALPAKLDASGNPVYDVVPNADGHVVRIVHLDSSYSYEILVESAINPGNYVTVGRITDQDLNDKYADSLEAIINSRDVKIAASFIVKNGYTPISDISKISLGTVKIKSYSKFQTKRLPTYSDERELLGKNAIEDALIRFTRSYFSGNVKQTVPWIKEVNGQYEVLWDNVGNNVKLVVPTRNDVKSGTFGWDSKTMNPRGLSVSYGVPHLVVTPNILNSLVPESTLPILIPLEPTRLHKDTIAPLKRLYEAARTVEELTGIMLGTEEFATLVRDYVNANFIVSENKEMILKNEVFPITEFITLPEEAESIVIEKAIQDIAKLVFKPELKPLYFKSEELANEYITTNGVLHDEHQNTYVVNGKLIAGVAEVKDNRNLWTIQYSNDPTDRSDTSILQGYALREGHGPAQVILNDLASANNTVSDFFIQLRKVSKRMEGKRLVTTFKTHSVLGRFEEDVTAGKRRDTEYVDYKSFYQDPLVVFMLGENASFDTYTDLLDNLGKAFEEKEGLTRDQGRAKAYDLVSRYQAEHITTELLDFIVNDKYFDGSGRHNINGASLRTPIKLHTSDKRGIHDVGNRVSENLDLLSELIRSNFDRVIQTSVTYQPSTVVGKVKKQPKKITTVKQLLENVTPVSEEVDQLVDLLKKFNVDSEIQHLPNGIPVEKDGVVTLQTNVFATQLINNKTIIQTSIDVNLILSDREATLKLLHEVLHAITLPALRQGQLDAKKKLATKESEFYKTLVAIKRRFDKAITSKINPETGARYRTSEVYDKTPSKLDVFEFVANLANPQFIKLAKDVNLVPKQTKTKSIFREFIEAIAKFISNLISSDLNVYNSTVAVLDNYYSKVSSTNTILPIAVEVISPAKLESEFLSRINSSLSVNDEYAFEDNLNYIKSNFSHIIDVDTLPERFGDTNYNVEFNLDYLSLDDTTKNSYLTATNVTKLQYAYVDLPKQVSTFTAGGISTTRNMNSVIDTIFPEALSSNERNLLRSIIMYSVNGNTKIIDDLIAADETKLKELLLTRILSRSDKAFFMGITDTTNYDEAINQVFEDPTLRSSIYKVIDIIKSRKDDALYVSSIVEDRSGLRYVAAKNFVLSILRQNLDKDKGLLDPQDPTSIVNLIQDRRHIRNYIKNLINSPGIVLPSGFTVREANAQLNKYYAEIKELQIESTKSDRIHELNRLIGKLEDELIGIMALRDKDELSGKLILDKVFTDIYPKFILRDEEELALELEINQLAESEHIDKDRVDQELDAVASISEYIKKYNKSYELTLSESLKDYLSHISVGNTTISSGLAYIKTLQLVTSLDWSQDMLDTTRGIVAQLNSKLRESNISELDVAVINSLRNTILLASSEDYIDGISLDGTKSIVAYNNQNGTTYYIGVEGNVENLHNLTYEELKHLKWFGEDINFSPANTSTEEIYSWFKQIDIPTFNRLFTRAEAINALRGIMNTMGSMKETDIFHANRTNQNGTVFMMQRSKASGIAFTVKDTLEYSLFKYYENNKLRSLTKLFEKRTVNNQSVRSLEAGSPEQKVLFIREFFNMLGFSNVSEQVNVKPSAINDAIEQINGFLALTEQAPQFDIEAGTDAFNDWIEGTSVNEVSGYITRFSELIAASSDIIRNPSVRGMNGDKIYKYHESSWAYDTVLNLIQINKNNPVFKGATGSSNTRLVPEFLKSSLYNHNIFVRNNDFDVINKIYSIAEYEGARNLDNDSGTPYTRENMFYFYHRMFIQGFLDGSRQYKNSYYQFTYIPSDKPKHPLLRINMLSDSGKNSEITKAIETALTQILNIQSFGKYIDVANYQASVEKDLFRTFKVAERALKTLNLQFNEENIPALAEEINRLLSEDASKLLDTLLSEDIKLSFDKKTYQYLIKLNDRVNDKLKIDANKYLDGSGKPVRFKGGGRRNYSVKKEEILPMFDLFFKNNYVNSYFLNQIVTGDYMAYKKDASDIVKRLAGVFAPGIKGLVDPVIGMKPTYKTFVLDDTTESTGRDLSEYENLENKEQTTRYVLSQLFYNGEVPEEEKEKFEELMRYFADKYDSTDAQGFILPHRARELRRGFERSWGLGKVHKPVHFEVKKYEVRDTENNVVYTTAIPYYTKYSAIELDDQLVERFPMLGKLRTFLEKMGVDEALFNSAVKEGMLIVKDESGNVVNGGKSFKFSEIVNFTDEDIARLKRFTNPPILELSNRHYRLQHNPQADPNKGVSLFTQIIYFLNVYPDKLSSGDYATTQDVAQEVYEVIAELIKLGRESFTAQFSDDPKKLINFLKKSFTGPGAERALELIQNGISANHPLIEKRAIISIASGMEKATVKIKLPGGKLVLQSEVGVSGRNTGKLKYRFEVQNGKRILVADAIVPSSLLTREQKIALSEGKSIYTLPDLLGFRIPSTELHSAVALRIVDTYDDKNTNVIIVPEQLTPIHGSDQ